MVITFLIYLNKYTDILSTLGKFQFQTDVNFYIKEAINKYLYNRKHTNSTCLFSLSQNKFKFPAWTEENIPLIIFYFLLYYFIMD